MIADTLTRWGYPSMTQREVEELRSTAVEDVGVRDEPNGNLRMGTIEMKVAGEEEREYLHQPLLPPRGQTVTYLKANRAGYVSTDQEQSSNDIAGNSEDPSTPRTGTTHFASSSETKGIDIEDLPDLAWNVYDPSHRM